MKNLLLFVLLASLLSSCVVVQPTAGTPCQKPKRVFFINKHRYNNPHPPRPHHPHRRHH